RGCEVARRQVLGSVLAGGAGSRLAPLTDDRSKPAVSFGGRYRLIDFALSNLVNSGCRDIFVLTPHHSPLLNRHLSRAWPMSGPAGRRGIPIPAPPRGAARRVVRLGGRDLPVPAFDR